MASNFIPGAEACAQSCEPRLNPYLRQCEFGDGGIHSVAFTQCGITIDCPSNIDLICELYHAGQLDVVLAIGDIPEPEITEIESPFPCKRNQIQYYETTYEVELCYEFENKAFWQDICDGKYGQIIITLKNGLSKVVENLRSARPYDYSEDGIHKIKIPIVERHKCGVKEWFVTEAPLFDESCLE